MVELPASADLAAIPPAVRHRLREARTVDALARVLGDSSPWLGAERSLASIGYSLIEAQRTVEERRLGAAWLRAFPSVETAKRLAAIVLDATTPPPVRDQAIETLGDRQLRELHPGTVWTTDAIHIADEALGKLADAATSAGRITSERLPQALRHVQSEMAAAIVAKAPGLWADAIESFASPPLARVLTVSIGDLPAQHRLRILRLIAATLGEEAVPVLVSRSADALFEERLEMLLLAVAFGGERYLPRLEDAVRDTSVAEVSRRRAKWHLAHPGIVPTVRGLRIARTTAVLPPEERAARCRDAADDLAAFVQFERHGDPYVYTLWAWMVRGGGDPARTRELIVAHPASRAIMGELYLDDLARRGEVEPLMAAARAIGAIDTGALLLAIRGRPIAALELATSAPLHTPELACARVLACYRAGRPDLAERLLAEDPPPSEIVSGDALEPFPGTHERWLIERGDRPAIAALAGGLESVITLGKPAPIDAAPDLTSLDATRVVARRIERTLAGATVFLAGEHARHASIVAAIQRAGARVASGPAPDTDFYLLGERCSSHVVAQLERNGARRLRPDELGSV